MSYKGQSRNVKIQRRRDRFVKIVSKHINSLMMTFTRLSLYTDRTKIKWRDRTYYYTNIDRRVVNRFLHDFAKHNLPKNKHMSSHW
jgi:hypothetical protein